VRRSPDQMASSRFTPLPPLPEIQVEMLEDLSPAQPPGWLRLIRRQLRVRYPDGVLSRPFVYDAVHRAALDAAIIAAHYRDSVGRLRVYLRSCVRLPLQLRESWRDREPEVGVGLWELPAGLIDEEDYRHAEPARTAARRELAEELGFQVAEPAVHALGSSVYPTPGIISEKHHFFEVEVDPAQRGEPSLDGSALERSGVVVDVDLEAALEMCVRGEITDAKTELGLRRLKERFE